MLAIFSSPAISIDRSTNPITSGMAKSVTSIIIYVALLLLLPTTTTSETIFNTCSEEEYIAGTAYHSNLEYLLDSLVSNTSVTGFFNTTVGWEGAVVYGYGMCRGDLSPTQCQTCMSQAATDAESECPGRRQAALWYDKCRIRYSDQRFFSNLTQRTDKPYYFELTLVPDRDLFKVQIGKLLNDLQYKATYGVDSSRMFSAGSIDYTVNRSLYGFVQCTRDLTGEQCSQCLNEPIKEIVCCQNSDDVTFHGGSCYLRYSVNPFFNSSVSSPPTIIADAPLSKGMYKSFCFKGGMFKSIKLNHLQI